VSERVAPHGAPFHGAGDDGAARASTLLKMSSRDGPRGSASIAFGLDGFAGDVAAQPQRRDALRRLSRFFDAPQLGQLCVKLRPQVGVYER
jgi:hypothetical protein